MDIAGVMENKDEVPYIGKGMAGKRIPNLFSLFQACNVDFG